MKMTQKRKKHAPSNDQFMNQHFEELQYKFSAEGKEITHDYSPHSEGKISDHISFLIHPLLENENFGGSDFANIVIGFACVAWNASLLKIAERKKTIDNLLDLLAPATNNATSRVLIQNWIDDFIARKLKHFPNDRRHITSYKADVINDRLQLSVASVDTEGQQA